MRIGTKIITGYGVLIALMALVLAYQVALVHRLQSIHRNLAEINFQAAAVSLEMMRVLDGIEEYTKKWFLLRDPEYAARREEFEAEFNAHLVRLRSLGRSPTEHAEIDRLERFWLAFLSVVSSEAEAPAPDQPQPIPVALQSQIDALHAQVKTVYQSTLQERALEVRRSAETGRRSEWISWSGAAVALVISILVTLMIMRHIAEPLKHLTEGTRAISEGKFFYRLDTSRDDEFAQLAKDFNTMTARLNELDEMKKGFVSHVSHELKGPLASMQETIHVMLEEIAGALNEKQRRLLQLNFETGKRLSAMLGNLLDLSRLQAGVMEYELVRQDLVPLVRNVEQQFENLASEKNIRIASDLPDPPLWVACDSDRILQVLVNLAGNAVKFSPKDSQIRIALRRATELPEGVPPARREGFAAPADEHGFAVVSVSDSGPGIPDNQKEKIFEQFHQVKRGKKFPGQGVGLGLAICKIIVEAHRGALWVEDNPGGGSVFSFLLRAAPRPEDLRQESTGVAEAVARPES
jgi:two-component system sensor histidine kinase GlrK